MNKKIPIKDNIVLFVRGGKYYKTNIQFVEQ